VGCNAYLRGRGLAQLPLRVRFNQCSRIHHSAERDSHQSQAD
jgi:hypothetical protein